MRQPGSHASAPMPRWLLATLGLLGLAVFINYIDRGNLATAAPLIKDELHLSASQLGFLLTAFFITYIPMQIVVGWLSDRFGAARVLLAGFVVWSVTMALTGLAHTFATLVLLRLVLGVGESVFSPASAAIITRCFPESYRGTANGVIYTGMFGGPAFGTFFGGLLIASFGWRAFFVAFGLVSLAWVIPWLFVAQPRLVELRAESTAQAPGARELLRERSLWGASLGQICESYALYFVLFWIPYYLVHERGWSLTQMASIGGVPISRWLWRTCWLAGSGIARSWPVALSRRSENRILS